MMSFLQVLLHIFVLRPFLKIFSGINVVGKENLHDLDRFIITANHNSHLDTLLLFYILPVKQICRTHVVAAEEYFSRSKVIFWLVDCLLRPIWIVRGKRVDDPLREMKEKLSSGRNIIIFPEGTRGSPGEIGTFKTGIGRLAVEFGDVPIVPVFLAGPEKAFPKKALFPLPIWNNVTIGPPQVFAGDCHNVTESMENMVRELAESETACRHRRHEPRKPPFTVAVLGIDGSGKSTLSRAISREMSDGCRTCLVTDSLELYENMSRKDVQPLLTEKVREAVGKYAKTAKSLKLYKIPKMAELLLRDRIMADVGRWYTCDIVVMDGSPLLNIVAWAVLYKKGQLSEETCAKAISVLAGEGERIDADDPIFTEFPELMHMKRLKLNTLKLPDVVLFLDVRPATACERITVRGKPQQVHETEEKLGQLREAYRMSCDVVQRHWHIPTAVIDGEDSIETVTAAALEFINQSRTQERDDHEPSY